jgi:microcystin-dependent protein
MTVDDAGSHSHDITVDNGGSHSHTLTVNSTTAVNQNTGGGAAHNIMQPYITLNYIIKV